MRSWPPRAVSALLAALLLLPGVHAQERWWGRRRIPPRFPPETPTDRAFTFCRIMYDRVRREAGGQGWSTDYPDAERHLMRRLAELTTMDVSRDSVGEPNHFVVRLTDDALFTCPFTMASDVGTAGLSPEESERLRSYLLKGGFLWVDDFWGTRAWEHWRREIGKVLPGYAIEEVPLDDPIFTTLYDVPNVPQITSIQFWRRVGGATTSERGLDSDRPHVRAIRDAGGRIMVLMTYNTDIADAWEREGEEIDFFDRFAHDGYAFGINVLLHAITH